MNASMPELSVVMPAYNAAPYIRESIDSVLAAVGDDTEIVVVDDGSTDETPRILAGYGDRIRVVAGEHAGLSAARNRCLEHATGRWVAFHDADDVVAPGRFASLRRVLAAHPGAHGVFGNGARLDDASVSVVPAPLARACAGRRLTARDLFDGYPVYFQAAVIAREAFRAAGPFDAGLPVQPDIEYGYRLFTGFTILFVDEVVFRYRVHDTNMSSDRLGTREDIVRILERLAAETGAAAETIGRARLEDRLARHYYRIARTRLARGERAAARTMARKATALRPFNPRYQLLYRWQTR
jgi:glycosyltransferase involved in cell wall biosynthesis